MCENQGFPRSFASERSRNVRHHSWNSRGPLCGDRRRAGDIEGCRLIHMLAEIEPGVRVFNLDTGYQFQETLDLREQIKGRYGIAVEMVRPELTIAEYETEHGGPLYRIRPDQCCHDRKVLPLRKAVVGYEAWISAIRRDQTAHRAAAGVVQWDGKFGLVKVNPLLSWAKKDVWRFLLEHEVPYNP